MRSLYKMCACHSLLPRSLHFELDGDTMDAVLYRGGFADVLKREHRGREVAVKALRIRDTDDLRDISSVGHFYSLHMSADDLTWRL